MAPRFARTACLLFGLGCVPAPGPAQTAPSMESLSFMVGCWRQGDINGLREHFTPPAANMMTGLSQFWRGDRIVDWEFHRIDLTEAGPALTPHPRGEASVSFTATELTASRVVFSNPDHDFPNRIIYDRVAPDSLVVVAEADGPDGRRLAFRMARVSCTEP